MKARYIIKDNDSRTLFVMENGLIIEDSSEQEIFNSRYGRLSENEISFVKAKLFSKAKIIVPKIEMVITDRSIDSNKLKEIEDFVKTRIRRDSKGSVSDVPVRTPISKSVVLSDEEKHLLLSSDTALLAIMDLMGYSHHTREEFIQSDDGKFFDAEKFVNAVESLIDEKKPEDENLRLIQDILRIGSVANFVVFCLCAFVSNESVNFDIQMRLAFADSLNKEAELISTKYKKYFLSWAGWAGAQFFGHTRVAKLSKMVATAGQNFGLLDGVIEERYGMSTEELLIRFDMAAPILKNIMIHPSVNDCLALKSIIMASAKLLGQCSGSFNRSEYKNLYGWNIFNYTEVVSDYPKALEYIDETEDWRRSQYNNTMKFNKENDKTMFEFHLDKTKDPVEEILRMEIEFAECSYKDTMKNNQQLRNESDYFGFLFGGVHGFVMSVLRFFELENVAEQVDEAIQMKAVETFEVLNDKISEFAKLFETQAAINCGSSSNYLPYTMKLGEVTGASLSSCLHGAYVRMRITQPEDYLYDKSLSDNMAEIVGMLLDK